MGKNKLQRYKDVRELENVFEYTDFQYEGMEKPKGKWSEIFGNRHPVTLELACGKGEYTLTLARKNPERNFVGIDIKGARIWVGANLARDESLENVHFIRMFIDHIEEYFGKEEVDEIWITFPDPYLREKKENKRLTSVRFLNRYRRILKPGGIIHLKTDSESLFQFTLNVIESEQCNIHRIVEDVYREAPDDPLLSIQTHYEKQHLSNAKTIKYISFSL
jgi:tRNA (guanine-N7-)-methyltransferase